MQDVIINILAESIAVKDQSIKKNLDLIEKGADRLVECLAAGHKILIFGNGGSAADAQHIAAELVNRFQVERSPLAVIALTTDTSVLTSIGNDYDFGEIFAKQLEALGAPDDIAWAISTSGNSLNVIKAVRHAKDVGMFALAMTGRGGKLAEIADLTLKVDSENTARIQETHITMAHILCDLIERILFPQAPHHG